MSDALDDLVGLLQPEGLVLAPNVLREMGLWPERLGTTDTDTVSHAIDVAEAEGLWPFFKDVLRWDARLVAGAPDGPPVSADQCFNIPDHNQILRPDWVVMSRDPETKEASPDALVLLRPDMDADSRVSHNGWTASPHQYLERLCRETGVGIGILCAQGTIRLIYAPKGETAGWMTWPLAPLSQTKGRELLAGLKLALDRNRFTGPATMRLRPLLEQSRRAQNDVSTELAAQVLGALHELLRGLHEAEPKLIEGLAKDQPQHLYEGLLSTLMRLVFLLYAEDRDLLPTSRDPAARALWQSGYATGTLFKRLEDDAALNGDTMEERRGAWGQLLAVFRMIHGGRPGWITRRGGALFDPNAFPFLEGRSQGDALTAARVMSVSDGCIQRVLEGLMTLPARTKTGARERLSYRTLDVEQIGSVYETVIGFQVCLADEPMIALASDKGLPTFVSVGALGKRSSKDAAKYLADLGVKVSPAQKKAIGPAKTDVDVIAALTGNERGHRVGAIDRRGSPRLEALPPGTPYLQPTAERRSSGSHYTPRELTHPIVEHALNPAFERLGHDATPDDVLNLKVCDPACGSGAFLVEACRQIASRLQHAWSVHGRPSVPSDEDEATFARRLVAQRCLYGVDRNPMAVDLCKLSLWLATLADEHEFTFLDHAIRAGDSLVGLNTEEMGRLSWAAPKRGEGPTLFSQKVAKEVAVFEGGRSAIRNAPDSVTRDVQEATLKTALKPVADVKAVADAIVTTFFAGAKAGARNKALSDYRETFETRASDFWDQSRRMASAFQAKHGWLPFHWQLEFPEVFAADGFDAIIGNPPFAGKNTISAASGPLYIPWLQRSHPGAHGNADLAAHFFRRAFDMLRPGGAFGLIASNTIAQGDTRTTGLLPIVKAGGGIARAVKRLPWPGEAAVMVSVVHVVKGSARSPVLDDQQVDRISAWLVPGEYDDSPEILAANTATGFVGSYLLGKGYMFDDADAEKGDSEGLSEMQRLIEKNPDNAQRISPCIGGDEVTTSPTHQHNRFAINFEDFPLRRDPAKLHPWQTLNDATQVKMLREGVVSADYPGPVAADWSDLLPIIERLVKPDRDKQTRDALRVRWWQYAEKRPGLYRAIEGKQHVLANSSKATPHMAFAVLSGGMVYTQNLNVFLFSGFSQFATMQNRAHEIWARFVSASLKDDLAYSISDCFETFPFPEGYEADADLEAAGKTYHDHRAAVMVAADEGMTKTYNRFHDYDERRKDIIELRRLHAEMDAAVLRAYGWDDLADIAPVFLEKPIDAKGKGHRPGEPERDHTYQGRLHWTQEVRDKILRRLLALNAARAQAEREEAREHELAQGGKISRAKTKSQAEESAPHDRLL